MNTSSLPLGSLPYERKSADGRWIVRIGVSEARTPLEFTYMPGGGETKIVTVHARAFDTTPISGMNSLGIKVRPTAESDNFPEEVKDIARFIAYRGDMFMPVVLQF